MNVIDILKKIYILPIVLVLVIIVMIKYIEGEYYNDNIIQHEINKVYDGEDYYIDTVINDINVIVNNNKKSLYIISGFVWLFIVTKNLIT